MKILFLTIDLPEIAKGQGGLYADIVVELAKKGHEITAIAPCLQGQQSGLYDEGPLRVLRVESSAFRGNVPAFKKFYGVLMLTPHYKKAFKKYLWNESFDWIVMPTPPASLIDVVTYIKDRTNAKFYLLLRDIHPECRERRPQPEIEKRNDIYKECLEIPYKHDYILKPYLRNKAQKGYKTADLIGCMSPRNVDFVKKLCPAVNDSQLVVLPNWYKEPESNSPVKSEGDVRSKYGLECKYVAIFGGTITAAQAVWNIATLAKHYLFNKNIVFLIVGRGNHKQVLERMAKEDNLENIKIIDFMPREDYEQILKSADVGLISLDEKYIVPTCPSKVIGYMALAKPVIAMINEGNDYGDFYITKSGCGLYSTNQDHLKMFDNFNRLYENEKLRKEMGMNGYNYYRQNLTVEAICETLNNQLING